MRAERLVRLLPEVMQRANEPGSPLQALLCAMETLHAPAEGVLARLPEYFDPRRAPERLLPYLASWVDLDLPITAGPGRLRELIALALEISQLRGTEAALIRFLTVASGSTGFEIDESPRDARGRPRDFHIVVRAPRASWPHEALLRRIIELEKPAHVTYELVAKP